MDTDKTRRNVSSIRVHRCSSVVTPVRVLKWLTVEKPFVYRPLMHGGGCERLEFFMQLSASRFFAKLRGCMPENLYSPKSQTRFIPSNFADVCDATTGTTKLKPSPAGTSFFAWRLAN